MASPVVKKFDLLLNLSIGLFAIAFALGSAEFFKAYLYWLNLSVALLGNLILLFVTLYIFSSIIVGIRYFPNRKDLPRFLLMSVITFISVSILYAYVLVIGFVSIFEFIGESIIGGLTPLMQEQMALANNLELLLKDSDDFEAATFGTHDTVIFDTIVGAENRVDNGFIDIGIFLAFGFGFVIYAIKSNDFSFFDLVDEIYWSTDATFKGLIRFFPLFAFFVGLVAALNLNVNFTDVSLLAWIGVLVLITLGILITVATLISLLANRPFFRLFIQLLQVSFSSLAAPSVFLMLPVLHQILDQRLGIARNRIQLLLPSTLLLCNMGIVLSCVLLLALTLQYRLESNRSLLDLISPVLILLDQAQALPIDLAGLLTQFNQRLEVLFGFNSGMYIPLIIALLPMLVIFARPLSIMFVMIVVVVVVRSSGDSLKSEDFEEIEDEQLYIMDISPIMMLGITTCVFLSILMTLAVGYSIAITGVFLVE